MLTFDTQFSVSTGSTSSGIFTYETGTPVAVHLFPPPTAVTVNNLLSSFSITLSGITWQLDRPLWVNATGGTEGIARSRSAPFVSVINLWSFGETFSGTRALVVQGQQNQTGGFQGSWMTSVLNGSQNISEYGSWTATQRSEAIPEPTTMAGMALAAGFGAWARRQQKADRN